MGVSVLGNRRDGDTRELVWFSTSPGNLLVPCCSGLHTDRERVETRRSQHASVAFHRQRLLSCTSSHWH